MRNLIVAVAVTVFAVTSFASETTESDSVLVELFELPDQQLWPTVDDEASERFRAPAFALTQLPRRYAHGGLIVDRAKRFVVRASSDVVLPAGDHQLLLRVMQQGRLLIDNEVATDAKFALKYTDGHNVVPELSQLDPAMKMLAPGHAESLVEFSSTGESRRVSVEVVVGGKDRRPEIGELSLSVKLANSRDSLFHVLSANGDTAFPMVDAEWEQYASSQAQNFLIENSRRRRESAKENADYWNRRHLFAKQFVESMSPIEQDELAKPNDVAKSNDHPSAIFNDVDRYLSDDHRSKNPVQIDDLRFLRRLALDAVGVVPSTAEINTFLDESADQRRANAIRRFLADDRWADHWVSYWQDVLAENPGILKPKLNNTGPFRWWIHESFLDNKPMDRFVTELIMMNGSKYAGGPAGFSLATQNDVPMAAKAHVLGQAFLGVQMKCARCHDAPHHDLKQEELFNLAAMLKRKPQQVPMTSTVDATEETLESLAIQVSLKPGSEVDPAWPFGDELKVSANDLPDWVLQSDDDPREQLAALITSPANRRFAEVMVNRLWCRFVGVGIVDSVDDWEHATNRNPKLLEFLSREFVSHDYDLKHIASLIFNSFAYQCEARGPAGIQVTSARRRLSAEQMVDSLFAISGKSLKTEMLNLDVDAQRPVESFLNLGAPKRAWEFTSLSNERDRPALSMPRAQSIVDVLSTFGWRDSRQDPLTHRDDEPTVQQPGIMANGVIAQRTASLSEDSAFTELCLEASNPTQLAESLYQTVLTRSPTDDEKQTVVELLSDGFEQRKTHAKIETKVARRHAVSWSNHLNEEATRIKLELEADVMQGDPPTVRLTDTWRERVEDVIWALINSPEFALTP